MLCCSSDGCPANCTCEFLNPELAEHQHLRISCEDRQAEESDNILTQEINDLLANNTQLKELSIQQSSLTQVPSGVCNLTSLEVLNLDDNRLVSLPDNCLSRLSQLMTFSASDNRIAYLQVLIVKRSRLGCRLLHP